MKDFITGLMHFRRDPWESLAVVIIALGVLMLLQGDFFNRFCHILYIVDDAHHI